MKKECKCILQQYMSKTLSHVRLERGLSQDKFAEILMINQRSYSDLETGKHCCCALTLALFLVFCCSDVQSFIDDLRKSLQSVLAED